jgi:hypothetical protein
MSDAQQNGNPSTVANRKPPSAAVSQSVEWYYQGEERIVDVGGIRIAVRFVARKGRRARIAITAPPGAAFRTRDRNKPSGHQIVAVNDVTGAGEQ